MTAQVDNPSVRSRIWALVRIGFGHVVARCLAPILLICASVGGSSRAGAEGLIYPLPFSSSLPHGTPADSVSLWTGSASYSYHIDVPPGTNGMQPNISLVYNSQRKWGALGYGWSIGGLGTVSRGTKKGVPRYDGTDTFEWNGEDLLLHTDGYYHTRHESYHRIENFNGMGAGSYWVVTDKSGRQYRYGGTDDSRIEAVDMAGEVRVWALDRITDSNGNYMTVTYVEDIADGDYYPDTITYTYNDSARLSATRSVKFNWDSTSRPDVRISYEEGAKVETNGRLTSIEVKAGINLIRKYTLAYTPGSGGKSLLTSVTECGTDGTTCLPPTHFAYFAPPKSFVSESWGGGQGHGIQQFELSIIFQLCSFDVLGVSHSLAYDVNGDALPDDLSRSGTSEYSVRLNRIGGFGPSTPMGNGLGRDVRSFFLEKLPESHILTDLNGDGLIDDIHQESSGAYTARLNTGSGFGIRNSWSGPDHGGTLLDMNGDGLPDHVKRVGTGDYGIWLNTGGGFAAKKNWGTGLGTGTSEGRRDKPVGFFFWYTVHGLMDMNGDGLVDDVYRDTGDYLVRLNTGRPYVSAAGGFAGTVSWGQGSLKGIEYHGADFGNRDHDLMDINGDGLPDDISANNDGTLSVRLNSGTPYDASTGTGGFAAPVPWGQHLTPRTLRWTTYDYDIQCQAEFAVGISHDWLDMNGDGLADKVYRCNRTSFGTCSDMDYHVAINQAGKGDLLQEVTLPAGGSITYDYAPAAQFDNLDLDGKQRLPFPMWVVTSVTFEDGLGGSQPQTYSYKGGLWDAATRELRGFREVKVTDGSGAYTVTTFLQDAIFRGLPSQVDAYDATNALMSRVTNTYFSTSIGPGIDFAFLQNELHESYEKQNTAKKFQLSYTYDSYGNVATKHNSGDTGKLNDASTITNEYGYNTNAWIVDKVAHTFTEGFKPRQAVISRFREKYNFYDGNIAPYAVTKGNLTRTIEASGDQYVIADNGYDAYGNRIWMKDGKANAGGPVNLNGHTKDRSYDTTYQTLVKTETDGMGFVTTNDYDELMRQTAVKDTNNQTTSTVYDVFGRVTKVIRPGDSTTYPTVEYTYTFDGTAPEMALEKSREDAGTTLVLEHYLVIDGLGRTTQEKFEAQTAGEWVTFDTYYDNRGLQQAKSVAYLTNLAGYTARDNAQNKTSFTYDAQQRLTEKKYPDTTTRLLAYDPWKITATNENGKQTIRLLDAYGLVSEVQEKDGTSTYTTRYDYNTGVGELAKITDALGNAMTYEYDMLGRRISMNDPDRGFWTYAYDANGNLKEQKDAKNQLITFDYDALNRVSAKTYPGQTKLTYTYDTAAAGYFNTGRLVEVKGGFTRTWGYDARGRIRLEGLTSHDAKTWSMIYEYDSMDRLARYQLPGGGWNDIFYNNQGLPETVTSPGLAYRLQSATYNALGKPLTLKFGNQVTTNYDYYDTAAEPDPSMGGLAFSYRLKRLWLSGRAVTMDLSYEYDKVGNVIKWTDNLDAGKSQTFSYDDLDRLRTAVGVYGSKNYTYDPIGNITSKDGRSYTYGGAHRMTGDGTYSYEYDGNGNIARRLWNGVPDRTFNYTYDNMLGSVYDGAGVFLSAQLYDHTGTRIFKVWNENGPLAATHYFNKYYEEEWRGATQNVIKHWFVNSQRIASRDNDRLKYNHTDHLGSAGRTSDATGGQVRAFWYDPWGTEALTSGTAAVKYRFNDKELDSIGLYYYGARFYDPLVGRFVMTDTITPAVTNPQSLNPYAYTLNNPVKLIDPDGHAEQTPKVTDLIPTLPVIHNEVSTRLGPRVTPPEWKTVYHPEITAAAGYSLKLGKTPSLDVHASGQATYVQTFKGSFTKDLGNGFTIRGSLHVDNQAGVWGTTSFGGSVVPGTAQLKEPNLLKVEAGVGLESRATIKCELCLDNKPLGGVTLEGSATLGPNMELKLSTTGGKLEGGLFDSDVHTTFNIDWTNVWENKEALGNWLFSFGPDAQEPPPPPQLLGWSHAHPPQQ